MDRYSVQPDSTFWCPGWIIFNFNFDQPNVIAESITTGIYRAATSAPAVVHTGCKLHSISNFNFQP